MWDQNRDYCFLKKKSINADKKSPGNRERLQLHKRKRKTMRKCLRVWAGMGCKAPGEDTCWEGDLCFFSVPDGQEKSTGDLD